MRFDRPTIHPNLGSLADLLRCVGKDRRGNVLPIMAMSLIPLAGVVGGGVDMSRMYITKSRLQQACDAGSLAGRKVMGSGAWSDGGGRANTAALQFFDNNFPDGSFGTTGRARSFSEAAGRVTGTASAQVPMTIMRIFDQPTRTIEVACDADLRLPNTDVMFVLDVTGSMAETIPGDSTQKIAGLHRAVKCFFETVARLNSDEDCGGTAPTGGTSGVQIRFGFVPYSSNVNVGKLLPTTFFADNWTYQSRAAIFNGTTMAWVQQGSPSDVNDTFYRPNTAQMYCNNYYAPTLNTASNADSGTTRVRTETFHSTTGTWTAANGGTCDVQRITRQTIYQWTATPAFDEWNYTAVSHNIAGLKNGTAWNPGVTLPIGNGGTNQFVAWDGCIEERATDKQTSYHPIPAAAKDLQLDLVPTTGDAGSLWGPALPAAIYTRNGVADVRGDDNDVDNDSTYACPAEARKLQSWSTAVAFDSYVDGLSPTGSTYHDIGMIWGGRFVSPTGIFSAENANTPTGGAIERHLIFMTDGETSAGSNLTYAAYGVPRLDRRQTTGEPDTNDLNNQINARFTALCTAVKNKNVTLWVIYFGTTDTATTNRMTACATPGRFYNAANSTALINTFKSIAHQISQLRLTR